MRNLEREIGNVCRKVARKVVKEGENYSVTITGENVNDFLGVIKFRDTLAHEKSEVGLVTGLAWTEVGGSILSTEATVVDGKGKLTLTGKLGDVMQESAQAAMSLRALARAAPGPAARLLSQPRSSTSTCPRARFRKMARRPALPSRPRSPAR